MLTMKCSDQRQNYVQPFFSTYTNNHCWVLLRSWRTFARKATASSSPRLVLQQGLTPRCWQLPSTLDGLAENIVSGIYWRGLSSGWEIVWVFTLILTILFLFCRHNVNMTTSCSVTFYFLFFKSLSLLFRNFSRKPNMQGRLLLYTLRSPFPACSMVDLFIFLSESSGNKGLLAVCFCANTEPSPSHATSVLHPPGPPDRTLTRTAADAFGSIDNWDWVQRPFWYYFS